MRLPLRILALSLLSVLAARVYAQEPVDNDTWKSRCLQLSSQSDAIDKGSAPPELLQTTHGVAGSKFAAVASERGNAGQHYIACTLYFTAALAEHQGNGGKVEPGRAHTDIVLGGAEAKRAAGLPLSFKEKMDRASGKLNPAGKGSLTPQDLAAVYAAFSEGSALPPQNSWGNSNNQTPTPNPGGFNPTIMPPAPTGPQARRPASPQQYPNQPQPPPATPNQSGSPFRP
jgi:hypothetical protein